ncbi:hypothetical protein, partial [Litorimonas sp.]|uniref:hypothetical protein n=1 Tax=Litorimonas sp. TaxID=1892381 RepID=UPI003A83B3B9
MPIALTESQLNQDPTQKLLGLMVQQQGDMLSLLHTGDSFNLSKKNRGGISSSDQLVRTVAQMEEYSQYILAHGLSMRDVCRSLHKLWYDPLSIFCLPLHL